MVRNKIDIACFDKMICGQLSASWRNAGISLLAAFILIDLLIPLFFIWVVPRLETSPRMAFLKEEDWQDKAIRWLKARLLLAFAIYVFYRLFL